MSEGDFCPKHEIPLEAHRPEPLLTVETGFTDWVSVGNYAHPLGAEAARIRLDAESIPTFIENERMGDHTLYSNATGGVRLQVPRELEHEARVLLAQNWTSGMDEEDDLDDAWESLAPEPGSRRRSIMKTLIVVVLALPFVRMVATWLWNR